MSKVALVLVFTALIALVAGHAVLNSPKPWNASPNTGSPCGSGTQPSAAQTTWVAGSTVTLKWMVIAGDGAGTVQFAMDTDSTDGDTNAFTTSLGTLSATAVSGTPYTLDITVPAVTCGGGICTLQAKVITNAATGGGWFSCAALNIVPAGTPVAIPPPFCKVPQSLDFCSARNGMNLAMDIGSTDNSARIRDDNVADPTYEVTINNTNIIENGNDPKCQSALKTWVCGNTWPACGATAACKLYCNAVVSNCQINPKHQLLFDCANAPDACGAGSLTVSIVAAIVVALLAVVLM